MNRIVRVNYPVAELPEDLREGLAVHGVARVTVEVETDTTRRRPSLEDLMKLRRPPWITRKEIQAQIDELREDRDL